MRVWIVTGGENYRGSSILHVFDSEDAAKAQKAILEARAQQKPRTWDYFNVYEHEVTSRPEETV